MDYEQILFGLQPLLKVAENGDFTRSSFHVETQLANLDKLAVHLRTENNRDIIRESGLFNKLLRLLDMFIELSFEKGQEDSDISSLCSELVRCVANALVDNDMNREAFWSEDVNKKNLFIDCYVPKILLLESDEDLCEELKTRTIILCLNLCMDNTTYCSRISSSIDKPLLKFLIGLGEKFLEEKHKMGSSVGFSLLSLLCENEIQSDLISLVSLSEMFLKVSTSVESITDKDGEEKEEEEEADDEEMYLQDLLQSITRCIFNFTANEKLDLSDEKVTSRLQKNLFHALSVLHPKKFPNRLIVMREVFSSIGNISSNKSYSNSPEFSFATDIIKIPLDSYSVAAAMLVLSNSLQGPEDVNRLNAKIGLPEIVHACATFTDPIQYQGFLDLSRKTIKMDALILTPTSALDALSNILILCHDQSKYYQGLSPLLGKLVEKLLAQLSAGQTMTMLQHNSRFEELIESNVITTSLALQKLAKKHSSQINHMLENFVDKLIAYTNLKQEDILSESLILFHVTRALGVFITEALNTDTLMIKQSLIDNLYLILHRLLPLKDSKESAHEAVFNNARYIAGLVVSNKSKFPESELSSIAMSYF